MSRFGAAAPKCPVCGKSVYAAEEVKGPGGHSWHTMCFCCTACGKSMRGGEWKARGGEPICAACNRKELAPFAQTSVASASATTELGNPSAVSPEKAQQAAEGGEEKILSLKERMAALSSKMNADPKGADAPAPAKPSGGFSRKSLGGNLGNDPKCQACGKRVYTAEEIKGPGGRSWHALCFCCKVCGKSMRGGDWSEMDGEPACRGCVGKLTSSMRQGAANTVHSNPGSPGKTDVAEGVGSPDGPRISLKDRRDMFKASVAATGTCKATSEATAIAVQAACEADEAREASAAQASRAASQKEAAEAAQAAKAEADAEAARRKAKQAAAEAEAAAAAEAVAQTASAQEAADAEAKRLAAEAEAQRAKDEAEVAAAAQAAADAEAARAEAERMAAEAEAMEAAKAAADAEAAQAEAEKVQAEAEAMAAAAAAAASSAGPTAGGAAAADEVSREEAAQDAAAEEDENVCRACDNYRVDLQGKNFGDCKCGFPKNEHKAFQGAAAKRHSVPAPRKSVPETTKRWSVAESGFAPASRVASNASAEPSAASEKPCGNYRLDMCGKNFGDCVCGHSKAAHEAKVADGETSCIPVPAQGEKLSEGPVGEPCSQYRLDVTGKNFGDCKCGHPKAAHAA